MIPTVTARQVQRNFQSVLALLQNYKRVSLIYKGKNCRNYLFPLHLEVTLKAFQFRGLDYEDVLQYLTAAKFDCNFLITRNKKDFQKIKQKYPAKIKILTPEEFLKK